MKRSANPTKGIQPPPNAYTQDYYLTECDGHSQFLSSTGAQLPPRQERALEIAAIQPGQRILDIGSGRGEFVWHCARRNALAWGIDYAPGALALTERLPPHPKMAFQQARANHLPFAPKSFDTVFMLDVVEHLTPDTLHAALTEACRVLKPGGNLLVHTMPNLWYYRWGYPLYRLVQCLRRQKQPRDPRARWRYAHLHVNEQSPLSLRVALRKSGFLPVIWLESTQEYHHERNRHVRSIQKALTRLPLLKWIFCNDIFAIGKKVA